MDNPFLHYGRMVIIQRAQDNMNVEVCEAVRKLTLGCFDRESGKLFQERLTANLDEVLILDSEMGKDFLTQRMAFFTFQNHPDDILSLFAVMRYVFRAVSVVDTICVLIDKDGEPLIRIRVIYLTEFDKTIDTLKEKLTVIQLQQYMDIFKEFYDIAKAANIDGNVAASYFITTRLLNLIDDVCKMSLMYIECHPVATDLLILLCQSLPIMKYPDFILNKIKNVPAFLPDHAQQAQKLKIQAEAYEFKGICSLAIQRGKEARDLLDTDGDKEEMTELIKRMEEKQRLKESKSAVKIQPEPEPVKKKEKTKPTHYEAAAKILVLDVHIEPVISGAELQIVKGQFSCSTAEQFHESIIKYLISRAKEEEGEMPTENKLFFRFISGLDILRKLFLCLV
ncbi:uncharacterized protein LOC126818968 isoform X2 [Patella vulgata]|uniref:uncharacterized protein LOC126818968 isoform X2 n=1 Tax=Patella vulgata TaxID=6465 RepID=UPI00217FA5CB|nr:uncharacterized protein LOC126818968 isoform X2 [Patella vulgata]